MPDVFLAFSTLFANFDVRSTIDILVVAFLLFWLLVLLQGTTAISLIRAIVSVYAIGFLFSSIFQLNMVSWLLRNSFPAMLVAIPILFQPELRRVLEQVGRGLAGWRDSSSSQATYQMVDGVARACHTLAQQHMGALIIIERQTGLQDFIDRGISLDAVVSPELLVGLFQTTSPLHDGAAIIRHGRVVAARCPLPISDNAGEHLSRGMRHRAAMGIAERTDSIAIAVSEERATISVVTNGRMTTHKSGDSPDGLRMLLLSHYAPTRTHPRNGRHPEQTEQTEQPGVGVKRAP